VAGIKDVSQHTNWQRNCHIFFVTDVLIHLSRSPDVSPGVDRAPKSSLGEDGIDDGWR
jgi:hypothetical protein